MLDFTKLINEHSEDVFSEIPVSLEEFVSDGYLELDAAGPWELGYWQKQLIERISQVYKEETLEWLYGKDKGAEKWNETVGTVIAMVGKGGGKDMCAAVSCCYIVYKLLCLKSPLAYFELHEGDKIDILNVAVNADQANRVFFAYFSEMVRKSPWFQNRFHKKQRSVEFDHNITVWSGHSDATAWEGYNLFIVILDEISDFSNNSLAISYGDPDLSPPEAAFRMFQDSVVSRHGEIGKVVCLSFPRHAADWISLKYKDEVVEKDFVEMSHTFYIDQNIPADAEGNSFTINWTEDYIVRYRTDNVWCLRRPSWVFHPKKSIEIYKQSFLSNEANAMNKFAAEPSASNSGFFSNSEMVENFSSLDNGVDELGETKDWFKPKKNKEYYMHVDLALKHDSAVVSMAHVDYWKRSDLISGEQEDVPYVIVDFIMVWKPSQAKQVDFSEIRKFIMSIVRAGWPVAMVTFDQWQSDSMINYLNRHGVNSEKLSVGLAQYNDLKLAMIEGRVKAPQNEVLKKEMRELKITLNGKNVDHPSTGSKDISDSVCGSFFNAAIRTQNRNNAGVEMMTLEDINRQQMEMLSYKKEDVVPAVSSLKREKSKSESWLSDEIYLL